MKPDQIPESLPFSLLRPGFQPLALQRTETSLAFGAQTPKRVPAAPSTTSGCAPSVRYIEQQIFPCITGGSIRRPTGRPPGRSPPTGRARWRGATQFRPYWPRKAHPYAHEPVVQRGALHPLPHRVKVIPAAKTVPNRIWDSAPRHSYSRPLLPAPLSRRPERWQGSNETVTRS